MSAPQSVPDTALGFTQSELLILRHQQQLIAQQPSQRGAMADRGRGTSRHSQPSSRAASAASSQSMPGRIVLDPRSLSSLSASLDSLITTIRGRIQQLEDTMARSMTATENRSASALQDADDEIERMKKVLRDIDRLEGEIEKIKNIRDVLKRLRARVDTASGRLDRTTPSNHYQPPPRASLAVSARCDPRRR